MLHQALLVSSQVAFLFVLFLASVNLASANPVCIECGKSTADSASIKVVDYNVQISESGEQYNETIEVDTEKQTELFKVPAHSNVDHINILHDFKKNLSILLLPQEKICYLLPLDKELPAPRKLLSDLDDAKKPISTLKVIDNKYTVGNELTDRSVLSDELANFCSKYSIYYTEKMEDSLTVTRIQTGGQETRNRRQILSNVQLMVLRQNVEGYRDIPKEKVCAGGNRRPSLDDEISCFTAGKDWKVQCKVVRRTCYDIVVCDTVDGCFEKHVYNTIYCCTYVCM